MGSYRMKQKSAYTEYVFCGDSAVDGAKALFAAIEDGASRHCSVISYEYDGSLRVRISKVGKSDRPRLPLSQKQQNRVSLAIEDSGFRLNQGDRND
jgi:hypothetical protein